MEIYLTGVSFVTVVFKRKVPSINQFSELSISGTRAFLQKRIKVDKKLAPRLN